MFNARSETGKSDDLGFGHKLLLRPGSESYKIGRLLRRPD